MLQLVRGCYIIYVSNTIGVNIIVYTLMYIMMLVAAISGFEVLGDAA